MTVACRQRMTVSHAFCFTSLTAVCLSSRKAPHRTVTVRVIFIHGTVHASFPLTVSCPSHRRLELVCRIHFPGHNRNEDGPDSVRGPDNSLRPGADQEGLLCNEGLYCREVRVLLLLELCSPADDGLP